MITKFDQWQAALSDLDFAKEIFQMDREDAKNALAAKGFVFTDAEMDEFIVAIKEYLRKASSGELDESALENVSGGGHIGSFFGGLVTGLGAAVAGFLYGISCW